MEVLQDLFLRLSALSYVELTLGLLITGSVILVLEEWRLNLWALAAQYVLVGLLLVRVLPLRVALIKVMIGGMVCLILYLTARRRHWGREVAMTRVHGEADSAGGEAFSMGVWFRLAVALLAAVTTYALGSRYPFVQQPPGISQASYWLVIVGLLCVVLTRDPFKVGLGLLTFQSGFGILLATFERSLSVAALVGVVTILIALAISYLTTAQIAFPVEGDGR
jgi:hypothetical protein